jgi:DNA-binding transcriptional ArsR family regulator
METMSPEERRKILKAGGTPSPRAEDNGEISNGQPKRRKGNKHTKGRFLTMNSFADTSARQVGLAAQAVWFQLFRHARAKGVVSLSQGQIAERAGITKRTVIKAIKELTEAGMIELLSKGNNIKNEASTYRVIDTTDLGSDLTQPW